jgi:hypothetical protein
MGRDATVRGRFGLADEDATNATNRRLLVGDIRENAHDDQAA